MSKQSLLTFPAKFQIKIFGRHLPGLSTTVLTIAQQIYPHITEQAIQTRTSRNKNYLALTLTVTAQSQDQLNDLYRALSADPNILMVL